MNAIDQTERVPTVSVMRNGSPVVINASDYQPGDELAPGSDIPPGYVAPAPADTGKGKGKAPAPTAPAQVFTINVDGKFYLSDDKGNKLNPEGFDTQEAAAAAPVVTA